MPTPAEFFQENTPSSLHKLLIDEGFSLARQSTWLWKKKSEVPAHWLADISYLTGWSFEKIRPDIFERKSIKG